MRASGRAPDRTLTLQGSWPSSAVASPRPSLATLAPTFSAPRERVYAAWTRSDLLGRWSCPEGLTIGEAWNDLRVGGRFLVEMIEPGAAGRPRTRMVFVQRGFPSPESRDGHDEGWRSTLRQLDALLEAQP